MTPDLLSNVTELIDRFGGIQSPIECWKLNIAAMFIVCMLFLSVSANSTLLFTFYKYKDLRTPLNVFVMAMTTINLFGSISEFTYIIVSNFSCRWVFGKVGCFMSGFVMYSVGMMQIYLMTAITFERFYIIYKPMSIKNVNFKSTGLAVLGCALFSLFWSVTPLLGWSRYNLEGSLTQCGVEWHERSFNVTSYNISIFVFGFFAPIGVIGYCSMELMKIIKAMPNMAKDDEKAKKRMENERQLTINMLIYIAGFGISWTPYAIAAMISAFIDPEWITPMGSLLPALFAKTSMVWSTVFYIMSNKQIKYKIFTPPSAAKEADTSVATKQEETTA